MKQSTPSRFGTRGQALLVLLLIFGLQNWLSDRLSVVTLLHTGIFQQVNAAAAGLGWQFLKLIVLLPPIAFWLLNQRRHFHIAAILANAVLSLELVASTLLLVLILRGERVGQAINLIEDGVVMFTTNILTFGFWYWIIDGDPFAVSDGTGNRRSEFLFPQRASALPGWSDWSPGVADYLFLAFTMSTALGPTDTPVLSRRAKGLVAVQTVISLTIITVLIGRALGIMR